MEGGSLEKTIFKNILKECRNKSLQVNEAFVAFLVKLHLLKPEWNIEDDTETFKNLLENLMTKLQNQLSPSMIALKIQFYFTCSMEQCHEAARKNREMLTKKLAPLKNNILVTSSDRALQDITSVKKKMTYYCILSTGIGNPKEKLVYNEAMSALNSVMKDDELLEFVKMPSSEKEATLDQLVDIVAGIRLHNKSTARGESSVENLPDILDESTSIIRFETEKTLDSTVQHVNILTSALDKLYVLDTTGTEPIQKLELPVDVGLDEVENIKDMLIVFRQYEIFLRKILEELSEIENSTEKTCDGIAESLVSIQNTSLGRIAVPVFKIFPLFVNLARFWYQLQNQVVLVSKLSEIVATLEALTKETSYDRNMLEGILGATSTMSDTERLEKTAKYSICSTNSAVQTFELSQFPNLDKIKIQYLGFCPYKLVETKGGLIPGNPSMGMARFHGQNFVFSSPEACLAFSKNPEDYIERIVRLCLEKPQLIGFLEMGDALENMTGISSGKEVPVRVKSVAKGVQCETNFSQIVPPSFNKTYKWNVWDMKREALRLCKLTKCRTTSSQTSSMINKATP